MPRTAQISNKKQQILLSIYVFIFAGDTAAISLFICYKSENQTVNWNKNKNIPLLQAVLFFNYFFLIQNLESIR